MVRRRTEYDVLQSTGESRWFVVRAVHGRILKSRLLPPGTHLQREFVASIIAYIDEGWTIGDFSSRSAFYVATKRAERIEVMISASDPYQPLQSQYARTVKSR
jgi:hypothetical protein